MTIADGTASMMFVQDEYMELSHLLELRDAYVDEYMKAEPGPAMMAVAMECPLPPEQALQKMQFRIRRLLQ